MSEDSAIRQKLKEMAQLSVLSNRISEIQEKNLKAYPFVFFNDVKKVQIEYDLSKVSDEGKQNHGDHHVTYDLELDEENQPSVDKRFFCICEATRVLFWNDLQVRVKFNGKLVYESKDE